MQGLLKNLGKEPAGEDKAAQKEFVLNGMRILHGPETRDMVLERLSQGEPSDAVADVAMMALEKMEQSAEGQGKPIDDLTKFMGGNDLIGEIIYVGESAGIFKMDEEERSLALTKVISRVMERDIQAGKIDPQELVEAGKQAQAKMGMSLQDGANKLGVQNLNLPGVE